MPEKKHTSSQACSVVFCTPKLPMQFISMDLIGPFDPSNSGHKYALMLICMLTWHNFCVPLKMKTAPDMVQPYAEEV